MTFKNKIKSCSLIAALSLSTIAIFSNSSLTAKAENPINTSSLAPITYNGQNMFVAKMSYYDIYSDSEVGTSSTPQTIDHALDFKYNNFTKFNIKMMNLMKYNSASECPAKYPMYQGRQSLSVKDNGAIYSATDNSVNKNSNFWVGANHGQVGNGTYAAQGLVDSKLSYDSSGECYMTQSNPTNGKSSKVPYFDKEFLTTNKHDNSQLSLGNVRENISFPFRTETQDGITYYEFDSAKDTVRFNSSGKLEYKGTSDAEKVKDRYGKGGLFPDNAVTDSNTERLNFGYGMKIEVPFNMTADGKLNGKDMIFEFSGDDDVWVFIDGILALDLGGNHNKLDGSINFSTGETYVAGVKNPIVSFADNGLRGYSDTENYTNASLGLNNVAPVFKDVKTQLPAELKTKLADTSKTHTLTLFYMERGMDEANMVMKFNLPKPEKTKETPKTENTSEKTTEAPPKLENKDELDETAKTADETNIKLWIILLGISITATGISTISIKRKHIKY